MSQTRAWSAIEACANIVVGIGVSFTANLIVLPIFGLPVSLSQATGITVVFTFISFVRSYALRRFFNWHNRRHQ